MRIAIDIQGLQSLGSRSRGIGRYTKAIVQNILKNFSEHEYILVANAALMDISSDFSDQLSFSNVHYVNWYSPCPMDCISHDHNTREIAVLLRSYAFSLINPDIILITSFFEGFSDNSMIDLDREFISNPIVSIFYDLIPLINPDLYLSGNSSFSNFYFSRIEMIKKLDGLLAISSSSASEAIKYLDFDKSKVFNILSACDNDLFTESETNNHKLDDIHNFKPYILYSGASDPRKNVKSLLEAFSLLPWDLLLRYKLVLAGKLLEPEINLIKEWISLFNIEPSNVILLDYVSDNYLVSLYQNCSLFVFPSFHEGFGLPVLEAMSCGAPCIGSNCTRIPEGLGNSKAMFDPSNVIELRDLIIKSLTDSVFNQFLLDNAKIQKKKFSWKISSTLLLEACHQIVQKSKSNLNFHNWESFINFRTQQYHTLSMKINKLISNSSKQNLSLIASSIDLINTEVNYYSRTLINNTNELSWLVEGPFDSSYSLAILNRCFAESLSKFNINISLHITEGPGDYEPDLNFLSKHKKIYSMYKKSKSETIKTVVTSRNLFPPRVCDLDSRLNLLHSYGWEESEFPKEWVNDFNSHLQGISVMSHQVKKILIDNGVKIPIEVSGLGIDHIDDVLPDKSFSLETKTFKFLHISSCFPRKAVDILLKAYEAGFNSSDDVTLIIKTFDNPHNKILEKIEELKLNNSSFPDVIVIREDLDDKKLKSLYLMSNALVAPSRGEGFGLPIAEAMLLGLPVITTGWGGQTDFCNPDNSWLIDYKFAPAKTHFNQYLSFWAEPYSDHLKTTMRALYSMKDSQKIEKILNAKKEVQELKWDNVALKNLVFSKKLLKLNSKVHPSIGWVSTWNSRCGIASYSRNLIKNIRSKVTIFSPLTEERDTNNNYDINQSWRLDSNDKDDLSLLYLNIIKSKVTTVCIQFNYSFFDFSAFSELVLKLHNKTNIILLMHSTTDPQSVSNKKLYLLTNALQKCKRILVHTIADLNRLKSINIVNNVSLFPHGFIDSEFTNLRNSRLTSIHKFLPILPKYKISSYGFCLPNKGFQELIKAVKVLKDMHYNIELNIFSAIYSETYKYVYDDLIDLVNTLELNKYVNTFTEYTSDEKTLECLANQDLVVFPYQNTNESSSAAVRTGLASLRPVLVTPVPIFDDVSSLVHYLPGKSSTDIASGISNFLSQLKTNKKVLDRFQRNKYETIDSLRFSRLTDRLLNMINAIELDNSNEFNSS